jgi:hypothetical protein
MTQLLSPSRFIDFIACPHKEALRRAGVPKDAEDASAALIQHKGLEHEAGALAKLEAVFGPAVSIPTDGSAGARAAATREANPGALLDHRLDVGDNGGGKDGDAVPVSTVLLRAVFGLPDCAMM